jgi:chromosome segregation ATPase
LAELALVRGELVRSSYRITELKSKLAAEQATLEAIQNYKPSDLEVLVYAQTDPLIKEFGPVLAGSQSSRTIDTWVKENKSDAAQSVHDVGRMKEKYEKRIEELRVQVVENTRSELEKEIKSLEAELDVATKQQATAKEEVAKLRKEADRLGNFSAGIDLSIKKQATAKEEVAKLRKEADRLGHFSIENVQMRRAEIANKHKVIDTIASELDALRVEVKSSPRVTIVSKAEVPK